MPRKAVVLINVGTPDSPQTKHVRKYLSQFLNDSRVIDLPWMLRKILVDGIIVPFRASKSSLLYKKLWTESGSPLLVYLKKITALLQEKLREEYTVYGAMRYGNPSIDSVLKQIKQENFQEIVFLPLYPQYASSTTGTSNEFVMDRIRTWDTVPSVRFINQFYNHISFLQAFAARIRDYKPHTFDHIIFSYHGLPLSHIRKSHPGLDMDTCTCKKAMPSHGQFCYQACCYDTTRLLARELELVEGAYSTSFQSRLSKNWLKPFTDQTLVDLAKNGKQHILVIAPSFVADCLETTVEIGLEYTKLFEQHGGKRLVCVESLNDHPLWVTALANILQP